MGKWDAVVVLCTAMAMRAWLKRPMRGVPAATAGAIATHYCDAPPVLQWDHSEPAAVFARRVAQQRRPVILQDAPGIARRTDAASARALFLDPAYLAARYRRNQFQLGQAPRASKEGAEMRAVRTLESDVTAGFSAVLRDDDLAELIATNATSGDGAILVKVAHNQTFVYNAWAPLAELADVVRAVRGQPAFVRMHFDALFKCIAARGAAKATGAPRAYCYHSHTLEVEPDIAPIAHLLLPCTSWSGGGGGGGGGGGAGVVWCGNRSAHYFDARAEMLASSAVSEVDAGDEGEGARLAKWYRAIRAKETEKHTSINLWVGGAGSTAGTHFDMSHNVFTQVGGRRLFVLFPPAAHVALRIHPQLHPSSRQAQEDVEAALRCAWATERAALQAAPPPPCAADTLSRALRERLRASARAKAAKATAATAAEPAAPPLCLAHTLKPGETLYLPPLWFHWVS